MRALYEQGNSIEDVARLLGLSFSTVRRQLVKQRVTLRPNKSVSFIEKQRQVGRTPTEIARYLADRKFKTRHGKVWNQALVFNMIQRLKISAKQKE